MKKIKRCVGNLIYANSTVRVKNFVQNLWHVHEEKKEEKVKTTVGRLFVLCNITVFIRTPA